MKKLVTALLLFCVCAFAEAPSTVAIRNAKIVTVSGPVIAKVLAGAPLGETAFGLNAAKKDLDYAVQFGASLHAEMPVTASALACYEEAEAAGLGDADATAVSTRWTQRKAKS